MLLILMFLAIIGSLAAQELNIYAKPDKVVIISEVDRLLLRDWSCNNIPEPTEASDCVFVRRAYLDICGRLPLVKEAKGYVNSTAPDKREKLLDSLLNSEDFADYWTMRWCDVLRVKSEFPINLWPNAVYGYQRRIRTFIRNNEPFDRFVYALLSSSGSNFRKVEVNFYRATANRSPEGIAGAVALTFLGNRFEQWPETKRKEFAALFKPIQYKITREWKEEIVYWRNATANPNQIAALVVIGHPDFARAVVNRVWFWFFGRGIVHEADDLRSDNPPVNPKLLEYLSAEFVKSGYDFKWLCRMIVNSAAYRAACFQHGNREVALKHFAVYPIRRLEAEVLDDAIRGLTEAEGKYSSVIPEPFTFIPPEARAITLADGSMSSSFLLLFGRPARDSGMLSERNNSINDKQRLWLFNSGELYRNLNRAVGKDAFKKLSISEKIEELYWRFYSRIPSEKEKSLIMAEYHQVPDWRKWRFPQDLSWALVNSKEFLYQH